LPQRFDSSFKTILSSDQTGRLSRQNTEVCVGKKHTDCCYSSTNTTHDHFQSTIIKTSFHTTYLRCMKPMGTQPIIYIHTFNKRKRNLVLHINNKLQITTQSHPSVHMNELAHRALDWLLKFRTQYLPILWNCRSIQR